ncbi:NmrA family NAD(P)-binding protein [Fibrella aquatilis]|uniref:NmrA family NAD(P)-binding protein n=1 Tax=Fibrella aquatilis TaxID=2817059 RepID=A0A939G8L1_9BACT|nr:NmrA family NAD(P)-binding protein [Fibrella aquatilis]MBO0933856.1 NmrA family NAD(P)-binding protein [Fibrella aquatilis]
MKNIILVAGATGNLGGRIVRQLLNRGAVVRAIVRSSANASTVHELRQLGVDIVVTELTDLQGLTQACQDVACVVSAVQGLHDVIIDAQGLLLQAAIAANVPRFIPSDFCSDFVPLPAGENRNFDLRRDFKKIIDAAPIQATSIFNGAFAEVLTYNVPLLNQKDKTVGYWGRADWAIDFTTMASTAAFTAMAALDTATPRLLKIADFQISPVQLATLTGQVLGTPYQLVNRGSLEALSNYNKKERAAHPEGEQQQYPAWQQSQYLHSMFSVQFDQVDNARYPALTWTSAADLLATLR